MGVQDRIERYSRIRAWLDYPFEQRPRPHQILNQMCVDEQWLNLKLTNEGESWNLISTELVTVAGQSEYTIAQPVTGSTRSGKIYFVLRSTGIAETPYVPIPFEDMSDVSYGELPTGTGQVLMAQEKLAMYRTDMQDQSRIVRIEPTPQEVLTYTIWFYTGEIDRLAAAMGSSGLITEISDFIDLKSSLALLPYCKWSQDAQADKERRVSIRDGLIFQYGELKPEVMEYIATINAPADFCLGHAVDY